MGTTLKCEYFLGLGFQSYTYSLGVVVEDIALLRTRCRRGGLEETDANDAWNKEDKE